MNKPSYGKVYFAGAGPGDPELLTVKAARILMKAEVVITDRLVSEEILNTYASQALIVQAGKQGGSNASTPQAEINELIVQYAARFKTVVRLKGGDISLYSNILDELETVKAHHISYEIIPGITAMSGASAYTGVPLTARGMATGVRILTYYKDSAISDAAWKHLASFEETLVLYMSTNALPQLVWKLLLAGADKTMPFLVAEQVTTNNQFVHQFTLESFDLSGKQNFLSPSLIIMGKVTGLYEKFKWFLNNDERINTFKLLEEFPEFITLIDNIQQSTHVSRA